MAKFQQIQSTFCTHQDSHGRRQLRDDCTLCSPMRFRCSICLQPRYETIRVLGTCENAPEVPGKRQGTMKAGPHVFAVEGPGALCILCGLGSEERPKKVDGELQTTTCLWGKIGRA